MHYLRGTYSERIWDDYCGFEFTPGDTLYQPTLGLMRLIATTAADMQK